MVGGEPAGMPRLAIGVAASLGDVRHRSGGKVELAGTHAGDEGVPLALR